MHRTYRTMQKNPKNKFFVSVAHFWFNMSSKTKEPLGMTSAILSTILYDHTSGNVLRRAREDGVAPYKVAANGRRVDKDALYTHRVLIRRLIEAIGGTVVDKITILAALTTYDEKIGGALSRTD